jgi:hypothetical protein
MPDSRPSRWKALAAMSIAAVSASGEDLVNGAYEAPVESSPREQIEATERRLYELAETRR